MEIKQDDNIVFDDNGKGNYYQVKKEAKNKTKKIPKKLSECVHNFHAHQISLKAYGLKIHDNQSSASNDSCKGYFQVKKKTRNKIKKIPKKSTERVRNFRARQRALREYGLNIHDSHSSTSNDSFFEDTEFKTASLLSPIARNRRKVVKLKAVLEHSDRQIEDKFETLGMIWASKLNIMEETQRVLAEDLIYEVFKKGFLQDLTKNLQLQKVT